MGQSSTKGKKQTKTIRGRIARQVGNIVYVNFTLIAITITAMMAYCAGAIV